MDLYNYRYTCQRWWGRVSDVRPITVESDLNEEKVKEIAVQDAKHQSGSKTCNIQLLQRYLLSITPDKTYPSVTSLNPYSNQDFASTPDKIEKPISNNNDCP